MPTLELEKSVTFENIVVATDFSEVSARAVECATAIAGDNHAQLFVLHAAPPSPRLPIPLDPLPGSLDRELIEVRENLAKFASSASFQDVHHEEIAQRGPIGDVVEEFVRDRRADLLVLGTHGRTGIKKLVLGSVAEEIFRRAACPVLTVGPLAAPTKQIRRVLFATDFGPASVHALPYAVDFANHDSGELVLLHLARPIPIEYVGPAWYPSSDFIDREEMDKKEFMPKLKALLPSHERLKCNVQYVVDAHYPTEGIISIAKERNVDLIVMGVRDSGRNVPRIAAHMPWAVAYEVVCNAECPVLTVRG
jgi:nucleotide-binding universal stress UspA family protein